MTFKATLGWRRLKAASFLFNNYIFSLNSPFMIFVSLPLLSFSHKRAERKIWLEAFLIPAIINCHNKIFVPAASPSAFSCKILPCRFLITFWNHIGWLAHYYFFWLAYCIFFNLFPGFAEMIAASHLRYMALPFFKSFILGDVIQHT